MREREKEMKGREEKERDLRERERYEGKGRDLMFEKCIINVHFLSQGMW